MSSKEWAMRKETITLKTTTGCTKNDLLCWDTDGYAPATLALLAGPKTANYKLYVALETVAAPGAGQSTVGALAFGAVYISKVTGALVKGQIVGATTTAGKVGAWAGPDAPGSYAEATVQAEFDKYNYMAGEVLKSAASGDATVLVAIGSY